MLNQLVTERERGEREREENLQIVGIVKISILINNRVGINPLEHDFGPKDVFHSFGHCFSFMQRVMIEDQGCSSSWCDAHSSFSLHSFLNWGIKCGPPSFVIIIQIDDQCVNRTVPSERVWVNKGKRDRLFLPFIITRNPRSINVRRKECSFLISTKFETFIQSNRFPDATISESNGSDSKDVVSIHHRRNPPPQILSKIIGQNQKPFQRKKHQWRWEKKVANLSLERYVGSKSLVRSVKPRFSLSSMRKDDSSGAMKLWMRKHLTLADTAMSSRSLSSDLGSSALKEREGHKWMELRFVGEVVSISFSTTCVESVSSISSGVPCFGKTRLALLGFFCETTVDRRQILF